MNVKGTMCIEILCLSVQFFCPVLRCPEHSVGAAHDTIQKTLIGGNAEMKKGILVLLVAGACWGGTLQAQDWETAPLDRVENAAEHGDANAQYRLGWMYERGHGFLAQNSEDAAVWYRKAAEQGVAKAQSRLGWMYANGEGVVQDHKQAVVWYHKAADQGDADAKFAMLREAAEQGDADAQYNLGLTYDGDGNGNGDTTTAAIWFRKAAEQGVANAQFRLARLYYNGFGVEQDDKQACEWYRKAGEQGHSKAQFHLGMFFRFQGDVEQAAFWLRKAVEQGDILAPYYLGTVYDTIGNQEVNTQAKIQAYKQAYVWFSVAAVNSVADADIADADIADAGIQRDDVATQLTPAALSEAQDLAGNYIEQYKSKP